MTTTEKNIIIAKFIALDKGEYEILIPKFGWFDSRTVKNFSKFKFNESWDWLMLAFEKCRIELNLSDSYTSKHDLRHLAASIGTGDILIANTSIIEYIIKRNEQSK